MDDLSKLKIEMYDVLAVIIPGMLLICEFWVALGGWSLFAQHVAGLSASAFTLMLLTSFALGPVLQEVADATIKAIKGDRFFKSARDELWDSTTGDHVRSRIAQQLGREVANVDVAFDYCLTRIQGVFPKRDLFLANSDLARSSIVVCCFAVVPVARIILDIHVRPSAQGAIFVPAIAALALIARLCWARMVRFRALSETPVFHAYLAQPDDQKGKGAPV